MIQVTYVGSLRSGNGVYEVGVDPGTTVAGLIDGILARENEHGTVTLRRQGAYSELSCGFGRNVLNEPDWLPATGCADEEVCSVSATGSYRYMHYTVFLKPGPFLKLRQ